MPGAGLGRDSYLAVARFGLATASRYGLLATHRSGVLARTQQKKFCCSLSFSLRSNARGGTRTRKPFGRDILSVVSLPVSPPGLITSLRGPGGICTRYSACQGQGFNSIKLQAQVHIKSIPTYQGNIKIPDKRRLLCDKQRKPVVLRSSAHIVRIRYEPNSVKLRSGRILACRIIKHDLEIVLCVFPVCFRKPLAREPAI